MSNHIHSIMWAVITHLFHNIYTSLFYADVITYPCSNLDVILANLD